MMLREKSKMELIPVRRELSLEIVDLALAT